MTRIFWFWQAIWKLGLVEESNSIAITNLGPGLAHYRKNGGLDGELSGAVF
jgi:hypothetical protein